MMKLAPNCECCDRDLPADSTDARICSFECTFCVECVDNVFQGTCPNCGGNFAPRPTRPMELLGKYPPQSERHLREQPCSRTSIAA